MHVFDVGGSPVRRRVLELLADSGRSAGSIEAMQRAESGISRLHPVDATAPRDDADPT